MLYGPLPFRQLSALAFHWLNELVQICTKQEQKLCAVSFCLVCTQNCIWAPSGGFKQQD